MLKPLTLVVLYIQINGNNLKKNFKTTFMVTKKLYVKPLFEVLSLYTDDFWRVVSTQEVRYMGT